MEEDIKFVNCNSNDVLSFGEESLIKIERLKKLLTSLLGKRSIGQQVSTNLKIFNGIEFRDSHGDVERRYDKWFKDGVDCEILKVGANSWQKGKVIINLKVILEFCPEQSGYNDLNSSLDDIRKLIIDKG